MRYTQHMYPAVEGPDMCMRGRLGLWQTWLVVAVTRHPLDVLVVRELVTFVSWFNHKPRETIGSPQPGRTRPLPVTLAGGCSYSSVCVKQSSFLSIHPRPFHRCARPHTLPLSDTHSNTLTDARSHSCFFKPLLCKLRRDLGRRVWILS